HARTPSTFRPFETKCCSPAQGGRVTRWFTNFLDRGWWARLVFHVDEKVTAPRSESGARPEDRPSPSLPRARRACRLPLGDRLSPWQRPSARIGLAKAS